MDKALIISEFNKLYSLAKNGAENKKYKNTTDLFTDVIGQSLISIENMLISLNEEIEGLKKLN